MAALCSYLVKLSMGVCVLSNVRRFFNPMDCIAHLCPWDFSGKNIGVGCHFLLHRIFLTQRSNQSLLHCRQVFYR